jgi:DNA-binding IscR family transcriptional regulator
MGCLAGAGFCSIERCCVLRGALRKATHAFLETLDDYTLADLLAPRTKLVQSLGITSADVNREHRRDRLRHFVG